MGSSKDTKTSAKQGSLVWEGRPSVGAYIAMEAIALLIAVIILVTVEWLLGSGSLSEFFPTSIAIGGVRIQYPVELLTSIVIFIIFILTALGLLLVRARSKYRLYEDGLYVDLGIINLESTYLSPMAFSDARLVRTWTMRLAKRGLIIVDANDGRHFHLTLIRNPAHVQSLIRFTLGHPSVRPE